MRLYSINFCNFYLTRKLLICFLFFIFLLQLLIPGAASKVIEMLEKLTQNSKNGGIEIEVSEWFQTLTEDIVAQTAFGRSYEQGKAIFRLQAQQMVLASEAFQKVFIPGYRYKLILFSKSDYLHCIAFSETTIYISFVNSVD